NVDVDVAKNVLKDKGKIVAKFKFAKAGKPVIIAVVAKLNKAKENLSKLKERVNQKPCIPQKDGKIDYVLRYFSVVIAFVEFLIVLYIRVRSGMVIDKNGGGVERVMVEVMVVARVRTGTKGRVAARGGEWCGRSCRSGEG
nr:asparagine--tRNA ligase, cytoplasmic 1-like [Tanacetum cinerariifolium]